MLTVPTVFILGAGASAPFHFPTGLELSKLVVQRLEPGQETFNHLTKYAKLTEAEVAGFRDEFFHSGKNSVDAFLEHRADLVKIGKLATAEILIGRELAGVLFTYDDNWLREIYNRLNTSFEEFGHNRLSFVTFNYDRTVEHFLFDALKNSYKKTVEEVRGVLEQIPIVHLHGRLGFLPWQKGDTRPFTNELNAESLSIGAENIKIIHEGIDDGREDFRIAKELLATAEQIVFMGFGYNPTNIQRLGVADIPAGKAIGTVVHLGGKGESAAMTACNGKVRPIRGDCLHCVREEVNWG